MKQHKQGEGLGATSFHLLLCPLHRFWQDANQDALEEIPRVGGTTAIAAGDTTLKTNSLIGGTKAMSKVWGLHCSKTRKSPSINKCRACSSPRRGIRRRQPSPCTHKTCSKNPKRGVCRNGGAPPRVLVIPQGGGYRGQA